MIRVLVIDDSAVMRRVLAGELSRFSDIRVVATAMDPYVARDKILRLKPDVLTLDLQMPKMDGFTFLIKLMKHYPLPVVVVSGVTRESGKVVLKALRMGAVEVIDKPGTEEEMFDFSRRLVNAVRAAAKARVRRKKPEMSEESTRPKISLPDMKPTNNRLIAIGASTGGTEAIETILTQLPSSLPPILIVQHMPECFTSSFAERLDQICALNVREAQDLTITKMGYAYIAPGNYHMLVKREKNNFVIKIKNGPRVHHQRPSVDVLFQSIARCSWPNNIGIILTGMGQDGAKGLLELRKSGGQTIAQDERTSIVYGMPREAAEINAAIHIIPLHGIAQKIIDLLTEKPHHKKTKVKV